MSTTTCADLFLFFIGKEQINITALRRAQIRCGKKSTFVAPILREQSCNAWKWKYLHILLTRFWASRRLQSDLSLQPRFILMFPWDSLRIQLYLSIPSQRVRFPSVAGAWEFVNTRKINLQVRLCSLAMLFRKPKDSTEAEGAS